MRKQEAILRSHVVSRLLPLANSPWALSSEHAVVLGLQVGRKEHTFILRAMMSFKVKTSTDRTANQSTFVEAGGAVLSYYCHVFSAPLMVDSRGVVVEGVEQRRLQLDLHCVVRLGALLLHVHHTTESALADPLNVQKILRAHLCISETFGTGMFVCIVAGTRVDNNASI